MNSNKFKAIKVPVLVGLCFFIVSAAAYFLPTNNYIVLQGSTAEACTSISINDSEVHQLHVDQDLYLGYVVLFLQTLPKTIQATCTKTLGTGDVISIDGSKKYELEIISQNDGKTSYKILGNYENKIQRNIFKSIVIGLYFLAFVLGPISLISGSKDRNKYAMLFISSVLVRGFAAYAALPGFYDYDAQLSHMNGYLGIDNNWFGNHYSLLWVGVLQLLDSKLSMTILQILVSSTGLLVLYDFAKINFNTGKLFTILFLLFLVVNPLILLQDLYISRDTIYGWGLCVLAVYLSHQHYTRIQAICFAVVVALTVNLRRETVGVVIAAVLFNLLLTRRFVLKGMGKNIVIAAVMSMAIAVIGIDEFEGKTSKQKTIISLFHYSAELMWNKKVVSLNKADGDFIGKYIDLEKAKKQRALYQPHSATGTFRDKLWGIDNKSYTRLISIFLKQIVTNPSAFLSLRVEQYLGSFNINRIPPDNFIADDFVYTTIVKKHKSQVELIDISMHSVDEIRRKVYGLSQRLSRDFPYIFIPVVLLVFASLFSLPGARVMIFVVVAHEAILFFLSPMSSMKYHYSFVLAGLLISALMLSLKLKHAYNFFTGMKLKKNSV